jgi:hypothetical protein
LYIFINKMIIIKIINFLILVENKLIKILLNFIII